MAPGSKVVSETSFSLSGTVTKDYPLPAMKTTMVTASERASAPVDGAATGATEPLGEVDAPETAASVPPAPVEIGGREGPEPTRFGDWEKNGRCVDF
jgi:hypothetical protein